MAHTARLVLAGALLLAPAEAKAEQACPVQDVEYALSGTLRIVDTPWNLANGTHKVGPGKVILRYEPGGRVSMLSYAMRQSFSITVKAFFSSITMVTESTTRATPDSCGVTARGVFKDHAVLWTGNVRGLRTEGTLTCNGDHCGKHGAPSPGTQPIAIGPEDVRVRAFEFEKDGRTFIMPYTQAVKTEAPKQTSFLALTGHEVKRTCVSPPPPCGR